MTFRGWAPIIKRLGVGSVSTAKAYARLAVDPLPVVMVRGTPTIPERHVDEWSARRNGGLCRDGSVLERVEGAEAIAERLGVTPRHVYRLAALPLDPLPLYGKPRSRWTYETSIRDWLTRGTYPFTATVDADVTTIAQGPET